ncbi:hypothetical protein EGT74_16695 [Chitinophaga lutea]|uniref:Uncharacterized protein n=1 Tax=Chitinophaga lutea TaxID=2488634 RepID=A0A3N4PLJ3_9BACT|nr:hypothetical protein [Chitinophaga lutea]RPE08675.1 hypothetical protein EGT74_16695 [Chitinophaga lutea]
MGYIREPKGVDFVVDPKPLTEKDRGIISEIIAYYKATGRKKRIAVRNRTAGTIKKQKAKH